MNEFERPDLVSFAEDRPTSAARYQAQERNGRTTHLHYWGLETGDHRRPAG